MNKHILLALALLFLSAAHQAFAQGPDDAKGEAATWWPGSQISNCRQTPAALTFRGDILTLQHPGSGYFMAFEANVASSGVEFNDGGNTTFLVLAEDKATIAAIMLAQAMGNTFRIQYVKDSSFWNRPILNIKSFRLVKS